MCACDECDCAERECARVLACVLASLFLCTQKMYHVQTNKKILYGDMNLNYMLVNESSVRRVGFALRRRLSCLPAKKKFVLVSLKLYSLCCHAFVRYPI